MSTGDQNHALALAIIERKNAEILELTQRAEAAEEDRDGWKLRAMQSEQQRQSLRAERDALRTRAEAAEADARSAWVEYAGEKETSAQCLSYLRQSEDIVDALTAERDALRVVDDAMVERFMFGYESVYRDGSTHSFSIRSGLDAALAVQPTTSTGNPK